MGWGWVGAVVVFGSSLSVFGLDCCAFAVCVYSSVKECVRFVGVPLPIPSSSLSLPPPSLLPLSPCQEYALVSCPQLIQAVHSLERWLQKKYTRVSVCV